MCQLQRVALNGLRTLWTVWDTCRVAEVHNCFVWQPITERFDHGQPANAGIKNADRSRVAHAAGKVTAWQPERNSDCVVGVLREAAAAVAVKRACECAIH